VPPRERVGIMNLIVTRVLLSFRTKSKYEEKGGFAHGGSEYNNQWCWQ
jgi:hypothetical protein